MRGAIGGRGLVLLLVLVALAACAEKKPPPPTVGEYKVGKPYEVYGVWYYPQENWDYRETGIASWYGPGFNGKRTANGEVFNENDVTAAHPTLPMPTMVQVTNLENGRSIKVRINDRGPFANNRIIDLSKRSAQLLDIERAGTAKVLVEILPDETRQLLAMTSGQTAGDDDLPQAAPVGQVQSQPLGGAVPASPTAPGVPQPNLQKQLQPTIPQPTAQPGAVPAQPVAPQAQLVPLANQPVQQVAVQPTSLYIQAGSFASATNAENLRTRLSAFGNAFVAAARIGTQDFYRVRVGPLSTVAEADGMLNRMIAAGFAESHIVVD
jgi:rare lipoprotein A